MVSNDPRIDYHGIKENFMKIAILVSVLIILAIACGGKHGGSSDEEAKPTELCNDYCDMLSGCGWVLEDFGNPCNFMLCEETVKPAQGKTNKCDDAMRDYFECNLDTTCDEQEFEPCPNELGKANRICLPNTE